MSGSTPLICPVSGPPARRPGSGVGGRGGPGPGEWLHLDVDATITIDHSDNKETRPPTWKKTWGHHSLLAFLDRPDDRRRRSVGRAAATRATPAATPPPTTSAVLGWALESLPAAYRPDPDDPGAQQVLVRCDSAGATHTFAERLPRRRGGILLRLRRRCPGAGRGGSPQHRRRWYPAIDSGGGIRDGAWVAEATDLVDMSSWPAGTRLILRKERPHPGAQLRFTDSDGLRVTAFITDTATRCGPRPARRAGTAPPPARPGGGPDPPGQGHRAAQPALSPRPTRTRHGWKSSWPQPIWWPGRN